MEYRAHPLAVCCWCGRSFVWGTIKGTGAWLCPNEPCHTRQATHQISLTLGNKSQKCVYVPLPRQVEFMESTAKYVLFGGAAGGSKSHALRWLAYLFALRTPEARVLLLRRTFADLSRTHMRDAELEAPSIGAQFVPSAKVIRFVNGSVIEFGHCEDKSAAANYLSAEYDLILFDELVTFERDMVLLIGSRARTHKAGVTPRVLAGTNPGGPQSAWVRQFYIDKNVDTGEFPHYKPADYAYIPSKLEDNPYLNADYEQSLLALPPELRKAYRDGDWDIFPGQFFPEWRRSLHVADLTLPSDWPCVRAIDWGFVKPGWCGWFVMAPDGWVYLEQEYLFSRTVASEVAAEIARRTKQLGRRVLYSVGDTSMWTPDSQTGETISETFARSGVPMNQADKDRINGWARLRHWLRPCPANHPWLRVSSECKYFARTLPSLISDETSPEDVDSDGEDHAADAARYWALSRPMPGAAAKSAATRQGSFGWWKAYADRAGEQLGILGR